MIAGAVRGELCHNGCPRTQIPQHRKLPWLGQVQPCSDMAGLSYSLHSEEEKAHTSGFVPLLSLMLRPFAILATLAPKRAVTATAYLSRGLSLSL